MTHDEYRGTIKSYTTEMVAECCTICGITFLMPKNYVSMLRETHNTFYCPNGHHLYYYQKTDAEKLKDRLRQKENELAQATTAKIQIEVQLDKANEKLNRVASGQCPCCDKKYKHLASHMASKHPESVK